MKQKLHFWVLAGISLLYWFTRLYNLKIIPIFTDEAIYAYWAQVALHDPANRFVSLEDGKQPLFIWIAAILQNFIEDPLVASRLVSVFAGFGSLIGIYLLTKELFDRKVALLASFLYIILPFTLLYDRMALFDSLVTMFGIWAILLSVKIVREPRLDLALLNGFAIGLAMITKSSGNFFLYFLPLSLLLINCRSKDFKLKFLKWIGFSLITFFITQLIYNSLRLSPLFYIIARKNLGFIRSYSEVLSNPFEYFLSNLDAMAGWTITYIGIPLFIIFLLSLACGFYKRNLRIIYLSLLIFLPFFAEAIFNKVLYARFLLFYFPYLIVIVAAGLIWLIDKFKGMRGQIIALFLLSLIIPHMMSFRLLTRPTKANIPENDSSQYLNSWPAGYGVDEIVEILKKESQDKKVYVGTEGTFGLLPFGLKIYFYSNNNVESYGYWPVRSNEIPQQVVDWAKSTKTFFIYNETQKEITDPHLKLIAKYRKGEGNSFMRLYEVNP